MAEKHDPVNERRSNAREPVRESVPESSEDRANNWRPVVAGLLLDVVDLVTWGPVGLWIGFAIGAFAGWMLAPSLGFEGRARWLGALGAGLYCMLPFTAILPLGTLAGFAMRLGEGRSAPPAPTVEGGAETPSIEADYTARWDPPER